MFGWMESVRSGRSSVGLTPEQQVITDAAPGPVIVQAGPGSGKTRVLTERIIRRHQAGTLEPGKTLATTFSRKASKEIKHRLWLSGLEGVDVLTVHGLGYSLIELYRLDRTTAWKRHVSPDPWRIMTEACRGTSISADDALALHDKAIALSIPAAELLGSELASAAARRELSQILANYATSTSSSCTRSTALPATERTT